MARRWRVVKENATQEALLVRAQPLRLAKEISQRIVDVVHVEDGAFLLEVNKQGEGKACIGR
jgi:hypothetical protein